MSAQTPPSPVPVTGIDGSFEYNFPEGFWDDDVTDEQRSEWFAATRSRVQALRQYEQKPEAFPTLMSQLHQAQRAQRRVEANAATVSVSNYR